MYYNKDLNVFNLCTTISMSVMWRMAANDGCLKVVRAVIPQVWSVGPLWAMKVLHFKITDYCFNGDSQISELIKTQRRKCFIFSSEVIRERFCWIPWNFQTLKWATVTSGLNAVSSPLTKNPKLYESTPSTLICVSCSSTLKGLII